MSHQRMLLIALFVSPALALAAVTLLFATLGYGALLVIGGAILLFAILSVARDFIQDYRARG